MIAVKQVIINIIILKNDKNITQTYPQPSLAPGGTNIDKRISVSLSTSWQRVGDDETSDPKDARSDTNCHVIDS